MLCDEALEATLGRQIYKVGRLRGGVVRAAAAFSLLYSAAAAR